MWWSIADTQFQDLDEVLGINWHYRVARVVSHMLSENIYLYNSWPILEYEAVIDAGGDLKFNPVYIDQPSSIVLSLCVEMARERS